MLFTIIVTISGSGGSRNFEKGGKGALQKGGPTSKIGKKSKYFGSQILSFTNIRW
jgi:hypothetical protein